MFLCPAYSEGKIDSDNCETLFFFIYIRERKTKMRRSGVNIQPFVIHLVLISACVFQFTRLQLLDFTQY